MLFFSFEGVLGKCRRRPLFFALFFSFGSGWGSKKSPPFRVRHYLPPQWTTTVRILHDPSLIITLATSYFEYLLVLVEVHLLLHCSCQMKASSTTNWQL